MPVQKVITDDMDALLDIFPPHIKTPLVQQPDISELLEVVLDLGRPPEARFPKREVVLDRQGSRGNGYRLCRRPHQQLRR